MEGAFYVWGLDEVRAALGADSAIFEGRYGLLPNGNAPFDPQQEFVNKNLLYTAQSITDLARAGGVSPVDVAESLLRSRTILFDGAQHASPAVAGRQGADRVERPDDRGVRSSGARVGG